MHFMNGKYWSVSELLAVVKQAKTQRLLLSAGAARSKIRVRGQSECLYGNNHTADIKHAGLVLARNIKLN